MKQAGLSGLMRVKNDAEFIAASIDSCIDALDELVVVYNDCTDHSPQLIEEKRQQYPTKIRVFEYKHQVIANNLTEEEYNYALLLPDDSPNLLCNYYNYALSKTSYMYAIKIDADQIYIKEQLLYWRNICCQSPQKKSIIKCLIGRGVDFCFRLYRHIGIKTKRQIVLIPQWLCTTIAPYYQAYALDLFTKGRAAISLSGINVFWDNDWFVSLGGISPSINILPPYNGEGDHLIFKVSDSTYYKRFDMPYYNQLRNTKYSLIEEFVHPYKVMYMGFAWFHLNAMRDYCKDKVIKEKRRNPQKFMSLHHFLALPYSKVEKQTDSVMHRLYQKLLFSYIHNAYAAALTPFTDVLNTIKR